MSFMPRTLRKGDQVQVAETPDEEAQLLFDGWLLDPSTPPAASPHRHVQVDEIATLPELKAAFVTRGEYVSGGGGGVTVTDHGTYVTLVAT